MENVSIQDAKILCENGLISQEQLLVFMQAKADMVKNIVENIEKSNLKPDVELYGSERTSIRMM